MIPKTIHYCWFGGSPLPSEVRACIRSWQKYCPDYTVKQWDETNYDITRHPFMEAAYREKAWAFVSDIARLDLIHTHGGIYLDTDVELKKNLDFLLSEGCFFGIQQDKDLIATGLGFGAEANHPAVAAMLRYYETVTFDLGKKDDLACPLLNTAALEAHGYRRVNEKQTVLGAAIYPSRFFDPLSPGKTADLTCPDTVSIHHYSASWTSGVQRFKRKLVRLVGADRIARIRRLLR